jgi:hypothetical protein
VKDHCGPLLATCKDLMTLQKILKNFRTQISSWTIQCVSWGLDFNNFIILLAYDLSFRPCGSKVDYLGFSHIILYKIAKLLTGPIYLLLS